MVIEVVLGFSEIGTHQAPRPGEAGPDRADRDVQCHGDLVVGQARTGYQE